LAEQILIGITGIVILGVGAQWLAWRLRVPSILLLLIFGFIAGPVTGFLKPDALLGDLLVPVVSISVAVILFEGGLSLRFSEIRKVSSVVRNLTTVGVLVTWLIGTAAARFILGLDLPLAVLLGAISALTGPTVIIPLLRHVRPTSRLGSILKWEGILNDPIGATLAVLVFQAILVGELREATTVAVTGFFKTVSIGVLVGAGGAGLIVLLLRRYWIPDFLHNAVSLMMVVGAFTLSNFLQTESGLLAVTLMGITLANQKLVTVGHILEFKENLRVLLISCLFILLAARLQAGYMIRVGPSIIAFLGVLMLVARPLVVALSTIRSAVTLREKTFLSWVAPRGIVAAAVASVFALRLAEAGYPEAERLVPLTFMVITVTVAVYGLTASPLARWLGVASSPQGVLIVGAHAWARDIAAALHAQNYSVMLVDTNWANISAARMAGLPAFYGSILSDDLSRETELEGIGRLLALTPNDEVNSLAALQFAKLFGRSEVYQLPTEDQKEGHGEATSRRLRGRDLFGKEASYSYVDARFASGATVKKITLSEEFDYAAFQNLYGDSALNLFLITEAKELIVLAADNPVEPQKGQTLISLVQPVEETAASNEQASKQQDS